MNITKMARQLLAIADDLRKRKPVGTYDFDSGEMYDFDQTWGSTALGFGGMGGQMITEARTYVFIPYENGLPGMKAFVYFGGRFAYECPVCDRLFQDIRNCRVASVMEQGRYKKESSDDST